MSLAPYGHALATFDLNGFLVSSLNVPPHISSVISNVVSGRSAKHLVTLVVASAAVRVYVRGGTQGLANMVEEEEEMKGWLYFYCSY